MIKKTVAYILFFLSFPLLSQTDSTLIDKSIFYNSLLKSADYTPVFNNVTTPFWPIIIFLICLSVLVSIKLYDSKKTKELLYSIYNIQMAKQLFREDYRLNKRIPIFFSLNFTFLFAFILFKLNNYYNNALLPTTSSLVQYVFFIGVVLFVYIIKFFATRTLYHFLNLNDLGKELWLNVLVYNHTLSVLLFPLALFLEFSRFPGYYFLYPALVVISLFYVGRLARTLIISLSLQTVGVFHFFVYFCTLEILPLLVLIKFLILNF